MATNLVLGPVLFQGFELPERIGWGGAQRLTLHRLPGGGRVIDAMGRDDAPIVWSGACTGPDAAERARLLDLMRAEGAVWPLTWDSFFYSVVVAEFRADYARPNWVPYRISCTVLRDEAAAAVAQGASLVTGALADLAAAGPAVDLSAVAAALGAPQATMRGTAGFAAAVLSVQAAGAGIDAGLAAGGTALAALPDGAGGVAAAGGLCGQLAGLAAARGHVLRVGARLADSAR